jgi:hypothetical protein
MSVSELTRQLVRRRANRLREYGEGGIRTLGYL